ncbi:MAG: DUF1501 domain-containing protein, partial [Candidatus Omnitrophica bacterium]|nr:DUF1501 domain-containing protein [Candidatus Omnitrophota bacterium]
AITGTLEARASWDSHSNNNGQQNQGFDNTFQGLHEIVTHLSNRPATSGSGTLLDQTTVVVMSEMGRTPKLNGSNGKDHWPITSVLMVGGGVSGNKVIGSTDDFQNSELVDFQTGQVSGSGLEISSANIGSTLLSMAGLNPNDFLPSTVPAFTAFRSGA